MILGIGTDIEKTERFLTIKDKKGLLQKCFNIKEQEYILSKKKFHESAAGIFCAKEALFKAMGTGMGHIPFTDAIIMHDEKGTPYFEFSGKAVELFSDKKVFVSISHTDDMAMSTVIIEKEDEK